MSDRMQYDRALSDFVEAVSPKDIVLQAKAVKQVINRSGGFNRDAVLGFLPALVHEWTPATSAAKYVPQGSRITVLASYATTPPTTGNCTVTLTMIAPGAGSVVVGTVTILNGQSSGETSLSHIAPAGSWLFTSIVANGASGVSTAAVRRLI